MEESKFRYKLLMITTLIISGCSIIYEVLISSVSSYLIGDSIKQFSITIGIYMSAMGIGFNIILVDLPDPNDENLNKLYTNIFYRLVSNRLDKDGVISIQSTSPYYAKEAFWCINKTLEEEGLNVIPYHVEVPSFGDWGFQLASKKVIEKEKIKINVETKFLNNESIDRLFMFSEDEIVDKDKLITNTIARPQLINYYLKAIENWR